MAEYVRSRTWKSLWGLFALVLAAAACSGADDVSSELATTGSGQDEAKQTPDEVSGPTPADGAIGDTADFQAAVADEFAAMTGQQLAEPPASGPPAVVDKSIAIVVITLEDAGAARVHAGVEEAADMLGWQHQTFDGQGDPAISAQNMEQAIALAPDAIVTIGLEAQFIQAGLEAAKEAGILLAGDVSWDLSSPETDFRGIFDVVSPPLAAFGQIGRGMALAAYEQTGGEPRLIMLTEPSLGNLIARVDETKAFVEECQAAGGSCEILAEEPFVLAEMTTQLPNSAAALARSNPDFNVLWVSFDFAATLAISGLEQAGLTSDDKFAVSGNADGNALESIANDGFLSATGGIGLEWGSFGLLDNLNRLFAGEEPVEQHVPVKLFTADNVPEERVWQGDVDFRDAYDAIWNG